MRGELPGGVVGIAWKISSMLRLAAYIDAPLAVVVRGAEVWGGVYCEGFGGGSGIESVCGGCDRRFARTAARGT